MSSNEKDKGDRSRNAIYVRVPPNLMKHLDQVCNETGAKPQQVLLNGLKSPNTALLGAFTKSATQILVALNRIGNNVNQIAKRVNSGEAQGWYGEFEKLADELHQMKLMLGSAIGHS